MEGRLDATQREGHGRALAVCNLTTKMLNQVFDGVPIDVGLRLLDGAHNVRSCLAMQ